MKEIKKPEKINERTLTIDPYYQEGFNDGYNQCCDEFEEYHNQEMNKRPSLSVEEIIKMIKKNDMFMPGIDDECCKDLALVIKEKMEKL